LARHARGGGSGVGGRRRGGARAEGGEKGAEVRRLRIGDKGVDEAGGLRLP
jgi:hypothetical protein